MTGSQTIWVTKWNYCMAIVNQIMSPLLPVALEIGQLQAVKRLKVIAEIHGIVLSFLSQKDKRKFLFYICRSLGSSVSTPIASPLQAKSESSALIKLEL